MKIYLSPSQQYYNKYSAGDTTEKEQCNRIAEHCEKALIRCGFEVKRAAAGTRTDDAIAESNAWGAQLHVPIHTNAGGGKGCVVFVSQLSEDRLRYAQAVYDELAEITVADESYGVRTARFDEIRKTSGKCIYVEAEFHDSVEGAEWIIENVGEIGEAICRGICKGAGVKYIDIKEDKQMERFKDIEGSRLKTEILRAAELGLMQGYGDGTFRPNEPLTRAQAAAVMVRLHDKLKEELK